MILEDGTQIFDMCGCVSVHLCCTFIDCFMGYVQTHITIAWCMILSLL